MIGTAVAESPTTGAEDALLLNELAEGVKREHEAASQAVRQSLAHARAAGEMLLEAKAKIPHGGFMKWVAEECGISHATANLYMRITQAWPEMEKSERVGNMTLREAAQFVYGADQGAQSKPDSKPFVPSGEGVVVPRKEFAEHLALLHLKGTLNEAWFTPRFGAAALYHTEALLAVVPDFKMFPLKHPVGVTDLGLFLRAVAAKCHENDHAEIVDRGDKLTVLADGWNVDVATSDTIATKPGPDAAAFMAPIFEGPAISLHEATVTRYLALHSILGAEVAEISLSQEERRGGCIRLRGMKGTGEVRVTAKADEPVSVTVDAHLFAAVLGVIHDWTYHWTVHVVEGFVGVQNLEGEEGPRYVLSGMEM